jgi:hypothetical protein
LSEVVPCCYTAQKRAKNATVQFIGAYYLKEDKQRQQKLCFPVIQVFSSLLLHPFQVMSRFGFFWYIYFCYMDVPRKKKSKTYNLKWEEVQMTELRYSGFQAVFRWGCKIFGSTVTLSFLFGN